MAAQGQNEEGFPLRFATPLAKIGNLSSPRSMTNVSIVLRPHHASLLPLALGQRIFQAA
jgi:hypothetical protein